MSAMPRARRPPRLSNRDGDSRRYCTVTCTRTVDVPGRPSLVPLIVNSNASAPVKPGCERYQTASPWPTFTVPLRGGALTWTELMMLLPPVIPEIEQGSPLLADITVTALGSDTSTFHMVEVAVDGR